MSEALSAFGADRVEAREDGTMALLCPAPKASWAPRREKTLTSAEHPGTAVDWNGRLFEVRRAEPLVDGRVRYVLAPWDDAHAIRRLERYDAESESGRSSAKDDLASRVRHRRLSILLAPLAGLLPDDVQRNMESEFGPPAVAMTIASALPLFVAGFLGLLDRFLGGLGARLDFPGWLTPPGPVALYLFGESALRLGSAVAMGEPMGSFPVVVSYAAWREARDPKPAAVFQAPDPEEGARNASDRFRMLEPLLALLSPSEQQVLVERFGFPCVRWGKITAAILLALGGTNLVAAVLNFAARVSGPADVFWLVVGGALTYEQIRRWRVLSGGQPAGSVLGFLVRPLARPLLAAPAA